MQFGVFTVGDLTSDSTTGRTPSEAERIKAMATIAKHAGEVGLDVLATGEHHKPPFVPSSATTMLGYVAARTSKVIPVLRRELDEMRPAHVPDGPTRQARVDAAALAALDSDTDSNVLEGSVR